MVLSWYPHQPESHQLSLTKVSYGHPDPKIGPQIYLGPIKNVPTLNSMETIKKQLSMLIFTLYKITMHQVTYMCTDILFISICELCIYIYQDMRIHTLFIATCENHLTNNSTKIMRF